jgi:hypothetical protein
MDYIYFLLNHALLLIEREDWAELKKTISMLKILEKLLLKPSTKVDTHTDALHV